MPRGRTGSSKRNGVIPVATDGTLGVPFGEPRTQAELSGHVVILNINEKVGGIIDEIRLGSPDGPPDIVVMVQDLTEWQEHPDWHPQAEEAAGRLLLFEGCPAEPADLEAVLVDRARAAVILADPQQGDLADAHSTLVAVAIERRSPQVHTVMELISSVNRVHLRSTEVNEVICLGELAEQLIAQTCITPGIANVFADLLHAHPGTTQVFVVELPAALAGRTYRQIAHQAIAAEAGFVLCGFMREQGEDGGAPTGFVLNPRAGQQPGKDTVLQSGDHLVVIAYDRSELERLFG